MLPSFIVCNITFLPFFVSLVFLFVLADHSISNFGYRRNVSWTISVHKDFLDKGPNCL